MNNGVITILCSGTALGVYVPGLILRDSLRRNGYACDIFLLEHLYTYQAQSKISDSKKLFHLNHRAAVKGHQKPNNMMIAVNPEKRDELFRKWAKEQRCRFIIFSGFGQVCFYNTKNNMI